MPDIKQLIDAKIRKLQQIRELADDPDSLALLSELLGASKNGNREPQIESQPKLMLSNGDAVPKSRRGDQQRAVEKALAKATEPVDTDWIVERMTADGFVFAASNPKVAVNECLRQAEKKGKAEIVGRKGVANMWRTK